MQPLSSTKLLEAWERGRGLDPNDRAVLLMAAADPDSSSETLADLPIGERDRRLIDLRTVVFGDRIASVVACPACQEKLDLEFSTSDIKQPGPAAHRETFSFRTDGLSVTFRLPSSRDIREVLRQASNPEDAPRALLFRCISDVARDGEIISAEKLGEDILANVMSAMEEADPQANVEISVSCPSCEHVWMQTFDIVSFIWTEIESLAVRLMQEVHVLASVYGWSEAEILGMHPRRRSVYLNMIVL